MPAKPRTKAQHEATMRNWSLRCTLGHIALIRGVAQKWLNKTEYALLDYYLELIIHRHREANERARNVSR